MSYPAPDPHQYGRYRIGLTKPIQRSGRRKALHSKVRTGCDNCKQRRIKCDEAQPCCFRCTRSDLVCKGYHPPEAKLFHSNTRGSQEKQIHAYTDHDTYSGSTEQSSAEYPQNVSAVEVNTPVWPKIHPPSIGCIVQTTTPPGYRTTHGQIAASKSEASRTTVGNTVRPQSIHKQSKSNEAQIQPIGLHRDQLQRSLQMWACTDTETRGLHFFFEKSLPLLRIFSSSADVFFTTVVPQMLFYESAVKHQVIALGLAHQRSLNPSDCGISVNVAKSYGYALRSLANNPRVESHILLSSCLLFLAIEMLCDGPIPALDHLKSGLRMLKDEGIRSRSGASASAHITHHLEPIFAQLAATSSVTGALGAGRLTSLSRHPPDLSRPFKSLDEANMKFLELFQWSEFGSADQGVSKSAAWQMWYKHLQNLRSQPCGDEFSRSQIQGKLLHAHFLMVQSRAEQRATGDEMSWDLHVQEYRRQLDECFAPCIQFSYPTMRRYPTFGGKLPGFDLPPGCFPPLWQMATICRDPFVRRQAIDLLRIHHERVGHDDECYGVLAAVAVMHLEEGDVKTVETSSDIPVHQRVRLHEVQPDSAGFLRCIISRWPFTVRRSYARANHLEYSESTGTPTLLLDTILHHELSDDATSWNHMPVEKLRV